ncbi:hypothetical protein ACE6H2_000529 [Prunus campanulata]
MNTLPSFLLLLLLSVSICSSMADFRVTLFNDLAENTNLNVQCQATSVDPSQHSILFLHDFTWNVNPSTVLSCDMSWGNVNGHFDIFDAKRDSTRCSRNFCAWRVKQDGLYLFIEAHKRLELQFTWPY